MGCHTNLDGNLRLNNFNTRVLNVNNCGCKWGVLTLTVIVVITETFNCAAAVPFFSPLKGVCTRHLWLHHIPVHFSTAAFLTHTYMHMHTHTCARTHTHTWDCPLSSDKCTYDSPPASLQSDSLSVREAQNGAWKHWNYFTVFVR